MAVDLKFTIKALVPDPKGKGPRNGPTVDTEIDAGKIAFAQVMSWNATDSTGQRFELIGRDDEVAPGAVKLLAIFLVDAVDSANVTAKFSPFNVLFTPVFDRAAIQDFFYYIGQSWCKTTVLRELLTPTGFNTIGMVLDGKRIKVGRSQGDIWINVDTVTEVLAQSGNEQGFVIKNYHPQPVPTLEYRLFVTPPDEETMRRARYAAEGKKQMTLKCAVGAFNRSLWQYVYPEVGLAADGTPTRRMEPYTTTVDALDILYVAYMGRHPFGMVRRGEIGKPFPDGYIPYFEVVMRSATPLPSLKSESVGDLVQSSYFLILPDKDQDIDDIIRLFYKVANIWHMKAEEMNDPDYAMNGKLQEEAPPVGDIWVSWALGNLKNVDYSAHTPTYMTNADYESTFYDTVSKEITIRYITSFPRTQTALAFRMWIEEDQRKQDEEDEKKKQDGN